MSSEQPQPQRKRRWPWIAGGVGAALLIATVPIVVVYSTNPEPPPPSGAAPVAPPATSEPAPSPSGGSFEGRGPNGCAGGEVIDANMVLTAQAEADESTDGAVEVAAAFTKWLVRSPLPSADEAAQVQAEVLATDAFTDDLAGVVAASPGLESTAGAETSQLTFANGVWQVDASTPESASVSVGARIVADGAIDTSTGYAITVDLVREEDSWRIVNGTPRNSVDALFQNGIEFDGGC